MKVSTVREDEVVRDPVPVTGHQRKGMFGPKKMVGVQKSPGFARGGQRLHAINLMEKRRKALGLEKRKEVPFSMVYFQELIGGLLALRDKVLRGIDWECSSQGTGINSR